MASKQEENGKAFIPPTDWLQTKTYEEQMIEFETARNQAVESFFSARPKIARDKDKEWLVESGFRMAWELLKRENDV